MRNKKTYLVITPFFPSDNCFIGNYIFDQVNEIRNQTNFNIEIIKVVISPFLITSIIGLPIFICCSTIPC